MYVGAKESGETEFTVCTFEKLSDAAVYGFFSDEAAATVILSLQLTTRNATYSIVDVGDGLALPDDYDEKKHTLESDNWKTFLESREVHVAREPRCR
jgi:hypothetical protein